MLYAAIACLYFSFAFIISVAGFSYVTSDVCNRSYRTADSTIDQYIAAIVAASIGWPLLFIAIGCIGTVFAFAQFMLLFVEFTRENKDGKR